MNDTDKQDRFDRLVAVLQEEIDRQMRETYSPTVIEHANQPKNMGWILDADGYGVVIGPCGDTMEIAVRLNGSRIVKAAFMTDGCGPTVACGSLLTTLVQDKTLEEAAAIDGGDLIIALDGLPPEHVHCATLAVDTLHEAIANCQEQPVPDAE